MGVFAILEEECIVPKATDMTFLQKLHNQHEGKHPKYTKPKISGKSTSNHHFEVGHYAGTVGYNVDGWLDKNKDPINEAVATLFAKSTDSFIAHLFKDYASECKFISLWVLLLKLWPNSSLNFPVSNNLSSFKKQSNKY